MRRKYVIAIAVGSTLGLWAMYVVATGDRAGLTSSVWSLLERQACFYSNSDAAANLQLQARFLKSCRYFLDNGFWFLVVPSVALCTFAKFTELALEKRWAFCVAAGVSATVLGSFITAAIMAIDAACIATTVESMNLIERIQYGFGIVPFLEACCWGTGFGELAALAAIVAFTFKAEKLPPFDARYNQFWSNAWKD